MGLYGGTGDGGGPDEELVMEEEEEHQHMKKVQLQKEGEGVTTLEGVSCLLIPADSASAASATYD